MPVTLKQPVFKEFEIKKSRFLAWVEPVSDVSSAKARIEELRQEYPDARHVCTAFYVQGNTGLSDDGEPSGTAAKPMFNVINHKGLVDVLAVVVRYFGGIKLGAGGLARAYGNAVSEALQNADLQAVEKLWTVSLEFPFSLESQVRRVCLQQAVNLADICYGQQVSATLVVPESQKEIMLTALGAIAPGDDAFQLSISG